MGYVLLIIGAIIGVALSIPICEYMRKHELRKEYQRRSIEELRLRGAVIDEKKRVIIE